jgi:arsenate reductase
MDRPFNVLFLCTGNSARSIMAEAILDREGRGNFRSHSAGSQPKGHVHPYTLDLLRKLNFDVSKLRSKSWAEFSGAGSAAPVQRRSISSLPSATTPRAKPVPIGPVNR